MLQLSILVKSGNIFRILLVWFHHSLLDCFRFIRCFPNDLFFWFTWLTVGGSSMEQKQMAKNNTFQASY